MSQTPAGDNPKSKSYRIISNMADASARVEAPIPVRQCARIIDSVHTEVIAQGYSDRVLVLVTQTGKIGSLTQVTVPLASFEQGFEVASGSEDGLLPALPVPFTSLQLTPLLSSTPPDLKPLYDVYLNQVAMLVFTGFTPDIPSHLRTCNPDRIAKPVIIGLALARLPNTTDQDVTDLERARFCAIMSMVMECKVW
ncbi:hypothetical protein PSHT_06152 [Puccinia striiformis]|nr:hypothetical protein Pst134EB_008317 [Puccinia striiformis f. sp. tritici]KNE93028.1 hypothetical protein PSTG_13601 [Puccinia striiformis f. sp. tritici PST-78]POW18153.1 hypothetical protein PSHT_06152 [Puccinia striiformis]